MPQSMSTRASLKTLVIREQCYSQLSIGYDRAQLQWLSASTTESKALHRIFYHLIQCNPLGVIVIPHLLQSDEGSDLVGLNFESSSAKVTSNSVSTGMFRIQRQQQLTLEASRSHGHWDSTMTDTGTSY
jgi:hypothetical protein